MEPTTTTPMTDTLAGIGRFITGLILAEDGPKASTVHRMMRLAGIRYYGDRLVPAIGVAR